MKNETYQTDIGRIPVGWVPYRVGELVSFSGGSQPDKSTFKFRPSKGYIRLIQIRDYKTDKYETYIPEVLARKTCGEHDVMIGRYGPPIFQILRGIKGAYNVALIKAIPSDKVDAEFFYHFIRNENLYGLMESLSRRSSGQTGVELSALREYPLPLPKKKEQIAIANALSDVDALIASLESLITKKRAIKTAAMQQLLTGKKRLPPFDKTQNGYKQTELGEIPEDWEIRHLGGIGAFTKGAGVKKDESNSGYIPCVRYGEIYTRHSDYIKRFNSYISKTVSLTATRLSKGDLLFAGSGETKEEIGKCVAFVDEVEAYAGGDIVILRPQWGDSLFLGYCLNSDYVVKQKSSKGQGDAVVHISANALKSVQVIMPSSEVEQQSIATVLFDMDKDIELLDRRLNKTQKLKQGMMQELLTGRTRLV
ncbi:MAG: restriction endonuclease subunit S [Candidatus Sedimenticola sp. (ex Thyasira tokunagai)]